MITEVPGKFKTLDGAEFPYAQSVKGARRAAYKAAEAHNSEVIAAREQAAGRALSLEELYKGIAHPETRTVLEQIRDSGATRTNQTPPDTSDWAARRLAELRANPGYTPEQRAHAKRCIKVYEGLVAKQEEAAARKAAEEEKAANPSVQRAIGHAKDIVDRMRFDPAATQAEVDAAQKRLAEVAKTGDHRAYWRAVKPYIDARDQRALAAANHVQQQAATLADRAKQIAETGRIPADVAAELAREEAAKNPPQAEDKPNDLGLYQQ